MRNGERRVFTACGENRENRWRSESNVRNQCGTEPKERRKYCLVPDLGGAGRGVALPRDPGLSSENTKILQAEPRGLWDVGN